MKKSIIRNYFIFFLLCSKIFCQIFLNSNSLSIPKNFIINDFILNTSPIHGNKILNKKLIIKFNRHIAMNSGHPNLDNNAEIYSVGKMFQFISSRIIYRPQKWVSLEIEPYLISHSGISNMESIQGTYQFNNNNKNNKNNEITGLRQSRIIIHYNGIGLGYGNMSHWWGPGFHSAIMLSSNAPSQETFSFGTFKDIKLGNFSFFAQAIIMPYKKQSEAPLFFSGLRLKLSYLSNPSINIGLNRTFLSGDFTRAQTVYSYPSWSINDAAELLIEPILGQSKRGLSYVEAGTPGFDPWDEIMSGHLRIIFPNNKLEIYSEIASDDNRANLADLRAHWDHTIAYQLGFKKYFDMNLYDLFLGAEFTTTRGSNTLNSLFYRGSPNKINFYSKGQFDYFTYEGRRMGAHSGSSSDDLVFMFGYKNKKAITLISLNRERHGIKNMKYPEIKSEVSFDYNHYISEKHSISYSMEFEKILNYRFNHQDISISNIVWLGYTFYFK